MRLEEPEFCGKFPIRQDITVLQADDSKKLRLGWKIYEHMGCEIIKHFDDWIDVFKKALAKKGYYGHVINKHVIKKLKGIKVGDKILAGSIVGMVEAEITEIDYDAKSGEAESRGSLFALQFAGDDRGAWVAQAEGSKSAIANIRVEIEKEIKNEQEKK